MYILIIAQVLEENWETSVSKMPCHQTAYHCLRFTYPVVHIANHFRVVNYVYMLLNAMNMHALRNSLVTSFPIAVLS